MTLRLGRGAGRAALLTSAVLLGACGSTPTGASPAPSVSAVVPVSSPPLVAASPVPSAPASSPSVQATPTLVPLSGRIVFARRDAAGAFEVFVIDADGTDERPLVPGTHEVPRWSPDVSHVSMTTEVDHLLTTAIVAADGTGYRVLPTPAPGLSLGCGAWSPDGARLACEGWDDEDPTRNGVYTIRASDGRDLLRVTRSPDGAHDIPGSYSPDGTLISVVRSSEPDHGALFTVAATGGNVRPIEAGDTFGSAFAPDGLSILVDGPASTLSQVTVADGSITTIAPVVPQKPYGAFGGRWSPDGQRIAFSMAPNRSLLAFIYTMDADGSDVRRLTAGSGQEEFADWAP